MMGDWSCDDDEWHFAEDEASYNGPSPQSFFGKTELTDVAATIDLSLTRLEHSFDDPKWGLKNGYYTLSPVDEKGNVINDSSGNPITINSADLEAQTGSNSVYASAPNSSTPFSATAPFEPTGFKAADGSWVSLDKSVQPDGLHLVEPPNSDKAWADYLNKSDNFSFDYSVWGYQGKLPLAPEANVEMTKGLVASAILTVAAGAVDAAFVSFGNRVTETITNPVPSTLARVVPGTGPFSTLGAPGAADVFVTDAAALRGLTPAQIAERLTIKLSPTYTIIEFPTPGEGLATPVFRTNPGFVQGGKTLGGAPEFVVPNGPVPNGGTVRIVGPQ
jgi:hypothetical protein